MAKLILHAGAGDDFEEAYRWYARKDRRAAERFEALVQQTLDRIVSDPSGGTSLDSMHRFYRAKPFPHLVIYRYSASDDTATVVAIAHPSRDQGYWQSR